VNESQIHLRPLLAAREGDWFEQSEVVLEMYSAQGDVSAQKDGRNILYNLTGVEEVETQSSGKGGEAVSVRKLIKS
jgi:hypothetical protein